MQAEFHRGKQRKVGCTFEVNMLAVAVERAARFMCSGLQLRADKSSTQACERPACKFLRTNDTLAPFDSDCDGIDHAEMRRTSAVMLSGPPRSSARVTSF
jgi:hypothetical protein